MSRAYNGWPQGANPPATHSHFNSGSTDQSHQTIRLPPASSLLETQTNHSYPAPSQQPRTSVPPHQPLGNYPALHHPQLPDRGTYYSPEHNVQQRYPAYAPASSPFHAPDPSSRDRITDLRDPRPLEAAQEAHYFAARAIPPSQQPSQDRDYPRRDMGIFQSSPKSPAALERAHGGVVPNLLSPDKADALRSMKFHLSMRQQPKAARACGSGERDRRNIDPPPILQLQVEGPGLTAEDVDKYLRHEGYVINCWIYDENAQTDASHMPSEYRYQRRLTGSVVSTPFFGKDDQGKEGCFFPFSDLSVRSLGRYRLKFQLCMIDTQAHGKTKSLPILSEIFSDVFDVYTAKEFPGINESSKLVRTLREQGCIIAIKKGNDKKKKNRGGEESSDEDDDDDDDRGPRPKRKHRLLIEDEA